MVVVDMPDLRLHAADGAAVALPQHDLLPVHEGQPIQPKGLKPTVTSAFVAILRTPPTWKEDAAAELADLLRTGHHPRAAPCHAATFQAAVLLRRTPT